MGLALQTDTADCDVADGGPPLLEAAFDALVGLLDVDVDLLDGSFHAAEERHNAIQRSNSQEDGCDGDQHRCGVLAHACTVDNLQDGLLESAGLVRPGDDAGGVCTG